MTARHPTLSLLSLIAACVLLGACPSATPTLTACGPGACEPDPVAALVAYRDHLVAKQPREAFTWLHPDATEGLTADGFALLYARHGEALIAQAEALLARAREKRPEELARVGTDKGDVLLVRTPEGWRLTAPPVP